MDVVETDDEEEEEEDKNVADATYQIPVSPLGEAYIKVALGSITKCTLDLTNPEDPDYFNIMTGR